MEDMHLSPIHSALLQEILSGNFSPEKELPGQSSQPSSTQTDNHTYMQSLIGAARKTSEMQELSIWKDSIQTYNLVRIAMLQSITSRKTEILTSMGRTGIRTHAKTFFHLLPAQRNLHSTDRAWPIRSLIPMQRNSGNWHMLTEELWLKLVIHLLQREYPQVSSSTYSQILQLQSFLWDQQAVVRHLGLSRGLSSQLW